MPADTKDRIVEAGADLFQRQGFTGTGIKQILTTAHAPFSSLYHFFPGGKDELGSEVVRVAGARYQELVEAVFDGAPDIVRGVRDCFAGAAETLRATDYADACPIATVALEVASVNEPLRVATAEVFSAWIESCTRRFRAAGMRPARARELAIATINLLEGAFVLSRALRSTEPLAASGAMAVAAVEAELQAKPRRATARR
ncbi:MAG TPA: TetR/AcrR family transcriptional regulator [Acidimicrobiia bacterium]|jgi:AcrR family transcriptional regulator|nr:TetR/AcrR family transcriptional regulator [Acidimicrobiia bacterium]